MGRNANQSAECHVEIILEGNTLFGDMVMIQMDLKIIENTHTKNGSYGLMDCVKCGFLKRIAVRNWRFV